MRNPITGEASPLSPIEDWLELELRKEKRCHNGLVAWLLGGWWRKDDGTVEFAAKVGGEQTARDHLERLDDWRQAHEQARRPDGRPFWKSTRGLHGSVMIARDLLPTDGPPLLLVEVGRGAPVTGCYTCEGFAILDKQDAVLLRRALDAYIGDR